MDRDILERIDKILEGNGDITERMERRLLLLALHELKDEIHATTREYIEAHKEEHRYLQEDIKELKKNNLMLWIKNNPLLTALIVLAFLFIADLLQGILVLMGIPPQLFP